MFAVRVLSALADECANDKKQYEHFIRAAAGIAKDAAPFIHPRLSTVEQPQGAGTTTIRLHVTGGLPVGSTPEKPEGDNYPDVPPEELKGRCRVGSRSFGFKHQRQNPCLRAYSANR